MGTPARARGGRTDKRFRCRVFDTPDLGVAITVLTRVYALVGRVVEVAGSPVPTDSDDLPGAQTTTTTPSSAPPRVRANVPTKEEILSANDQSAGPQGPS